MMKEGIIGKEFSKQVGESKQADCIKLKTHTHTTNSRM